QVLHHRKAAEEPGRLERAAEAEPAPGGGRAVELVPVEGDHTPVGGEQTGEAVEECRLARSVGPDDTGDLGRAGDEVDALEGVDAAEVDRQVGDLQDLPLPDAGSPDGQRPIGQLPGEALAGRLEAGQLLRVEDQRPAVAAVGPADGGTAVGHEPGRPPLGVRAEDLPPVHASTPVSRPAAAAMAPSTPSRTSISSSGLTIGGAGPPPSTRRQRRRPTSAMPPGIHSTTIRATIPMKNWS